MSRDLPPPDAALSSADQPLTVPLLVRGSPEQPALGGALILGILLALVGVGGLFKDDDLTPALVFFCLAAAILLPALGVVAWLATRRRWVQVTMTGFVLTENDHRAAFLDEQVLAVSTRARVTATGVTHRRVRLELAGDPEVLDCRYSVPADQQDPLAPFIERVVRGQAIRLRDNLPAGA